MLDLDRHLPGIVAGDPGAFARWVACAEPPLRRSLFRFAASVDTEAVLQETLLRVWQVAGRVERDGKPNALFRMALRIARNLAIDEARRTGRVVEADPEDEPAVEPREPDPLLVRVILACLELLPPQPRRALLARLGAHGGEEDGRLAHRVRMTLNTFLQNVTRARKLLLECLATKGVGPETLS